MIGWRKRASKENAYPLKEPPWPSLVSFWLPLTPDDLSAIILKCLEKDKANRYQSAVEVGGDLERVEKGLPTIERAKPGRLTPARKSFTSKEITVKFQPTRLIIPALGVIAAIIAAVIFWPKKASDLDPNLVAVAVFENKTGDPKLDPRGSMAAERIMQGLTQVGGFYIAQMPSAEAIAAESKGKDKLRALAEVTKAEKSSTAITFSKARTSSSMPGWRIWRPKRISWLSSLQAGRLPILPRRSNLCVSNSWAAWPASSILK